jgi:DNA-binding MarR family transcriptional regulator
MKNEREELLKNLIEKFIKSAHNMHSNQSFPFGDFMLGRQQIMILFFIYENKGLVSVKAIAKNLNVTPGAITQFVDGLVGKKLVIREENARDRRSTNIKLAPLTEKKFNSFKKRYLTNASRFFTGLSDEELSQFVKLLSKIKTLNPKI